MTYSHEQEVSLQFLFAVADIEITIWTSVVPVIFRYAVVDIEMWNWQKLPVLSFSLQLQK